MPTTWDANELERRTAAGLAIAGFVPALNVKDCGTQSEFDIYAYRAQPDRLIRLMVQCSYPSPRHEKIAALRGYAAAFGADCLAFVTAGKPHDDQVALAERLGIPLLSESRQCSLGSADVAGRRISMLDPPSARHDAMMQFTRCLATLRRIAWEARNRSQQGAGNVVAVWKALDAVPLLNDPFKRLARLYQIHFMQSKLSEDCAVAEGLGISGRAALKKAYAEGCGTYTQSALAVQTLNRAYTLIALCECACLNASGVEVPRVLDDSRGRRGDIVRSLARRETRHLLGAFVYEFLFGWGGFWDRRWETEVKGGIASAIGCRAEDIEDLIGFIDSLFRKKGMENVVKTVDWYDAKWRSLLLLPYFAKGVGVFRLQRETGAPVNSQPWTGWLGACEDLERQCRQYESSR